MRSEIYFALLTAVGLALFTVFHGCGGANHKADISFLGRDAVSTVENPLALVVSIDAGGKLMLNQIETGTVDDPALLVGKLRAIFEDRRRSSGYDNEVMVEMVGTIPYEDLDTLITSLKPLQLSRINVKTR